MRNMATMVPYRCTAERHGALAPERRRPTARRGREVGQMAPYASHFRRTQATVLVISHWQVIEIQLEVLKIPFCVRNSEYFGEQT